MLFVSDFHWDSHFTIFSPAEVASTRSYLEQLATQHQIAVLVVLGDIFLMQETDPKYIRGVFEWFSSLPVSRVLILPGNHDRNLGDFLPSQSVQKITIINEVGFTLVWQDAPVIYLSHDANGGYYSDPSNPQNFLTEMREILQVPRDCWLFTGHIHQPYINFEERSIGLGPFSCAAHQLSPKKDLSYSYIISRQHCCLNRYGAQLVICKRGTSQEITTSMYDIEIGEDLDAFSE